MTSKWHNLVAETQFATELVQTGIKRVCTIPMSEDRPGGTARYDETYMLNVGLHMYTSGLERLCKLALVCHAYVDTGVFPRVKKYSHRLSGLFDAVGRLDMGNFNPRHPDFLEPIDDEFDQELIAWLERYASGDGRYELLDSLSRNDIDVLTWDGWTQFCAKGVVSESVKDAISIRYAMGQAIGDAIVANDLESVGQPIWADFSRSLHAPAVAVGLAMHRRARRAAEVLATVTYYTREDLPILREAVSDLTQTTDAYFTYEIAGISDREPVIEELERHFKGLADTDDD